MKYFKKKTKIFTLLIIIGAIVVATSALAAADLSFSLSEGTSYKVGDTFRTDIVISPAEKIYTAKAQVSYPVELLKVESFTFNSNWMPISQSGYDTIDNNTGLLIKTAGYPGGISTEVVLGTATFRVLNSGETIIKFTSESLVLNAGNANVAGSLSTLNLTFSELPVQEETILPEEEITPLEEEVIPEEEKEVTPEESEEEVVILSPEEKIPEESLASLLLASLEIMQESAWMTMVVILCSLGLVVIGIKEWELVRKRKKE